MKIKVQTRKLAAGCSKHCFEVVDRTDEVSSKHSFEVIDKTDEVSYLYLRQDEADVVWRDLRRVLKWQFFLFQDQIRQVLACIIFTHGTLGTTFQELESCDKYFGHIIHLTIFLKATGT